MSISQENIRVQITMSKKLRTELEKRALKDRRTLSNYIVKILEEHIEKEK